MTRAGMVAVVVAALALWTKPAHAGDPAIAFATLAEAARHQRIPLVHISTWYAERPREHSMLVVDANQAGVQAPSPALGKPIATRTFGALTMYAYDFDLARGIQ